MMAKIEGRLRTTRKEILLVDNLLSVTLSAAKSLCLKCPALSLSLRKLFTIHNAIHGEVFTRKNPAINKLLSPCSAFLQTFFQNFFQNSSKIAELFGEFSVYCIEEKIF